MFKISRIRRNWAFCRGFARGPAENSAPVDPESGSGEDGVAMSPPTVHKVVLVLCRYDEKGQGVLYRERDCAYWFASLDSYARWIKPLPQSEKFYKYVLRRLSTQLEHLKLYKKDGFVGVVYDPQHPGAEMTPIDELMSAIASELARATTPEEPDDY
jgi:hypothetical protein